MKIVWLIGLITFPLIASAQLSSLTGKVIDEETKQPIEGANVFVGSTSLGASSGKTGRFAIEHIPFGSYDLLISMIGYETLTTRIVVAAKNPSYSIELRKKTTELDEVSVTADTAGWYNNYIGFTELFLGKTKFARQAKITNPRELTFYFDPNDGFYAHAKNPLVIENKALGYRVTYHLKKFERKYDTGVQYALGIPLFRDAKGTNDPSRRIRNARQEAFNGSLMHFFRALKQNNLEAEGFTVFQLFKIKNVHRPEQDFLDKKLQHWRAVGGDSLSYYARLNRLPKEVDSLALRFRAGEELLEAQGNPAVVKFTGMLRVIYTGEKEDPAFITFGDRAPGPQQSTLHFLRAGLKIYENGYYESADDLLLDGYLGWAEKLGDMLPLDYLPPLKH